MQGTHENRYIIEVDGVSSVAASECTMPGKEHTPFELAIGNQNFVFLGRGNIKVDDMSFKHAHALNESGNDLFRWLDDFTEGVDLSRRTVRMVVMDEAGVTPVDVYELQECVPRSFKPEGHSASGTGASMFTFSLRPTQMRKI